MEIQHCPEQIFREYEEGTRFKNGLGKRGLAEQNRINERFFAGDQWQGARCGEERPLVRYNVIKRIGDYKIAVVNEKAAQVRFYAEGVPQAADNRQKLREVKKRLAKGEPVTTLSLNEETNLMMEALSDHLTVAAERVGLSDLQADVLRNAYIGGSGVLYTYWDDGAETGLFADEARTVPVKGDIACEVLHIENVCFGDPSLEDVQKQPYVLVAQRRPVRQLKAQALAYGCEQAVADSIVPDEDEGCFGSHEELPDSGKATVLTRLWKQTREDGTQTVMGVQVCRGVVVRPPWDLGIRLYPLALLRWEHRRGCCYGDSEVTYLIPNQIAINRMMTASVWAIMMMGMPMMVVNGDVVNGAVSNDPGQILTVFGGGDEVDKAVRYINPPDFSPQFEENIQSLINNTLNQSGTNSALLGDVRPDNTSALLAVREAALLPLKQKTRRFYSFCEAVARIWAEFFTFQYGNRPLKIADENGVWYCPFDGERLRRLLVRTVVEVSGEEETHREKVAALLQSLYKDGIIDAAQVLERMPQELLPDVNELVQQSKGANTDG